MSFQSKIRRNNATIGPRNIGGGNDLPINVIHIVLSYLPDAKERAQKALISTSWLFACNTYPYLIFNQADIIPTLNLRNPTYDVDVFQKTLDSYISVVDGAVSKYERLSNNNETVKRLGLQLKFFDSKLRGYMDRWIQIALCHRVEDLTLAIDYNNIYDEGKTSCYTMPKEVFSNRFIQTLNLIGGPFIRLPFSSSSSGDVNINLSGLRSLSLSVPMDNAMLEKLILGCPLLEKLMFHLPDPKHIDRVRVPGLNSRLKLVEVTRTCPQEVEDNMIRLQHVDVDVPMLETFVLVKYGEVLPCRLNLDSCQNFIFLGPHFRDFISWFPSVCVTYENIKEAVSDDARGQKLLMPDLDSFKFSGSMHQLNNDSDIRPNPPYLQLIVKNSSQQCQANIKLHAGDNICFHWFSLLMRSLKRSGSSCTLEVASLSVFLTAEVPSIYLTEHLPGPPCSIKQLNLCFKMIPSRRYLSLLNLVFATVHPEKLCLFPESDASFLKSLCKHLAKEGDFRCCGYKRMTCWHHYLDGASFANPEGLVEFGPVRWKTLSALLPSFKRDGRPICFTLKWRVEYNFL